MFEPKITEEMQKSYIRCKEHFPFRIVHLAIKENGWVTHQGKLTGVMTSQKEKNG